jgi:hypothetical protein
MRVPCVFESSVPGYTVVSVCKIRCNNVEGGNICNCAAKSGGHLEVIKESTRVEHIMQYCTALVL